MAIYSYACRSCDHEFTEMLRMDDRKIPTENPCPSCGEKTVYQTIKGTPSIVSQVGGTLSKTSDGWKDVLKKVKSGSGRNNTIHD